MKVLLISADNLYLTPYISLYTELLDKHNVEYNVLYWDKNHNEPPHNNSFIRFCAERGTAIKKAYGYFLFRKAIGKTLKAQKYELVVCLHSVSSFLICDILLSKYKSRYVFDVRDYSFEKFLVVRLLEKQLVKHSAINIISSEGYKAFLPKGEYEIAHNLPGESCTAYAQRVNRNISPIRIGYIGLIRFMEQNKKIIDFFKNDSRFQLQFIGTNAEQLAGYCEENNVTNVKLIGTFSPEQTLAYYEDADIIMNLYGNHTPLLDYALSNKLYYAAMLYKPILVCRDTYMEKVSAQFGFGYVLDLETEKERDQLYEYMTMLDRKKLIHNCDKFVEYARKQQTQLKARLERFITQIRNEGELCN